MMEVVMKKDEDEYDDKTGGGEKSNSVSNNHFFPLLKDLILGDLSELKRFWDIAYTWVLPSLNHLNISSCPKLEALSSGSLNSLQMSILFYNSNLLKINAVEDINNTLRNLFHQGYDDENSENIFANYYNFLIEG